MKHPIETLENSTALETLWDRSHHRPTFLLKHSLICGTSFAALEQYQAFAAEVGDSAVFAILEIQPHRDLSRQVAKRSGVRHQSPQVLLVNKGEVSWSASHWSIERPKLAEALQALSPQLDP